jgi:hypothetical protein
MLPGVPHRDVAEPTIGRWRSRSKSMEALRNVGRDLADRRREDLSRSTSILLAEQARELVDEGPREPGPVVDPIPRAALAAYAT